MYRAEIKNTLRKFIYLVKTQQLNNYEAIGIKKEENSYFSFEIAGLGNYYFSPILYQHDVPLINNENKIELITLQVNELLIKLNNNLKEERNAQLA